MRVVVVALGPVLLDVRVLEPPDDEDDDDGDTASDTAAVSATTLTDNRLGFTADVDPGTTPWWEDRHAR